VPTKPGIGVDPVELDDLVYWREEHRPG
jgi:hypothetical protein